MGVRAVRRGARHPDVAFHTTVRRMRGHTTLTSWLRQAAAWHGEAGRTGASRLAP